MSAPISSFSRDLTSLLNLIDSATTANSQIEHVFWEIQIKAALNQLLKAKKEDSLEQALEYFAHHQSMAYELLVEHLEALTESQSITFQKKNYDVLLISAPIVLWTRYQLPQKLALEPALFTELSQQFQSLLLAKGCVAAFLPELLGFEQLPQSFTDTRLFTQQLGQQALKPGKQKNLVNSAQLGNDEALAEARFFVGAAVVPQHQPIFQWQAKPEQGTTLHAQAVASWKAVANKLLSPLFTGCSTEFLAPGPFYASNRLADLQLRPAALKASVTWLHAVTGVAPSSLRATFAACGSNEVEEYRIGLTTQQSNNVMYGCIWPVLTKDEANPDLFDSGLNATADTISTLLRELGVRDIRRLPGLHELDGCDDCGAPYFPNPLGELVHPELPEDLDLNPVQFH